MDQLLPQPKHTLVSSSSERRSVGKSAFGRRSSEFPLSSSRSLWQWPPQRSVQQECSHSEKEILPQKKPTSSQSSAGEQSASAKKTGVDLISPPSKKARLVSSSKLPCQRSPPQLVHESRPSNTKHTSESASRESSSMAETASVTMKDIDLIVPSKTLVIDLVTPPCAESRPSSSSQASWQRSPSQSFHELPRSQRTKLLPQSQHARVSSSRERISSGRSAPATGRVIDLDAALCSKAHLALSSRPLQPKVPRGSVAQSLVNSVANPGNSAWASARPVSHPSSNCQSARNEALEQDAEMVLGPHYNR